MLYRDGSAFSWDGRMTDSTTVNSNAEQEAAERDGWQVAREYLAGERKKDILDGTAKDIEAELPGMDLEALEALKASEMAGKTRKGVRAVIEAEVDKRLARWPSRPPSRAATTGK